MSERDVGSACSPCSCFSWVPRVYLTLKVAWAWKIAIIHPADFIDYASCLYQCIVDEDGWYQAEAGDSCLLVCVESAIDLREHVIQ